MVKDALNKNKRTAASKEHSSEKNTANYKRPKPNPSHEVIEILDDDDEPDSVSKTDRDKQGNLAPVIANINVLPELPVHQRKPLAGPTIQILIKNGEEILDSTEVAEETVENIAKFLMDNRSQQMLLTKSSVAKLSEDFVHALRVSTARSIQLAYIETATHHKMILNSIEDFYKEFLANVKSEVVKTKIDKVQINNLMAKREKEHKIIMNNLEVSSLKNIQDKIAKEETEIKKLIETEKLNHMKTLREFLSGKK